MVFKFKVNHDRGTSCIKNKVKKQVTQRDTYKILCKDTKYISFKTRTKNNLMFYIFLLKHYQFSLDTGFCSFVMLNIQLKIHSSSGPCKESSVVDNGV